MEELVRAALLLLSCGAGLLHLLPSSRPAPPPGPAPNHLRHLQRRYLPAYSLAVFADWLKGAYVYQLYVQYGYEEQQIATLYVAGFASSAVFGTLTGPAVDQGGRRRGALVFTAIYTLSALCKLSPSYWVLLTGRLLGGVATSLLTVTFESWYTAEHLQLGLPPAWLVHTFASSTACSGLLAILAGLVAATLADTLQLGPLAPFLLAVPVLAACSVVILSSWQENYGARTGSGAGCRAGFAALAKPAVAALALVQVCVETSMYMFVFLWTPALGQAQAPLGLVFSCFMLCLLVGSRLVLLLPERVLLPASLACMTAALLGCSTSPAPPATFLLFLLLELSLGVCLPTLGRLRGSVLPSHCRAATSSWIRLPTNLLVCLLLLSGTEAATVFRLSSVLCGVGAGAAGLATLSRLWEIDTTNSESQTV